jgi:hypothetical protein
VPTQLSEHFTREELTTTQHRTLDNTPGEAELANLKTLATETLEPVRALLGPMHVNSGFRSKAINAAVGGAATSQHCLGLACDFVPLRHGLKEAMELIRSSRIDFDQLIYEFGAWVHVSHAPAGRAPRKQALMIGKFTEGKYLPYDAAKAQ